MIIIIIIIIIIIRLINSPYEVKYRWNEYHNDIHFTYILIIIIIAKIIIIINNDSSNNIIIIISKWVCSNDDFSALSQSW